MSKAHWQKQGFNLRDLDPGLGIEEQGIIAFRDRRAQMGRYATGALGDGAVQSWKYVRPVGRDRHEVESPTDPSHKTVITSALRETGFTPGAMVTVAVTRQGAVIVGGAPQKGLSDRPTSQRTGVRQIWRVTHQLPELVASGVVGEAISVFGFGFVTGMTWSAVEYDDATLSWITDPGITVQTAVFVSATQYDLTLDVASSEPEGSKISYSVEAP